MPLTSNKERADERLVDQGLAADRKEALALLMAGQVVADGQRVDKPGTLLDPGVDLRLKSAPDRYVSRGGLKLEGALEALSLEVKDLVCLDLGASTGGFTDCLLQHGARRVHAFDVGTGQLDWKLQQDGRVAVHDNVNVRNLDPSMVGDRVDLIVADLSFISLSLVLAALKAFAPVRILALVKPQFEARREEVESGGLIRDESLRQRIVKRIEDFALHSGFTILGKADSPLTGRRGNQETFLLIETGD
ncbi:MAG: TlyA family RNA methyltransferase [Acidobacteriota bacterium]